MAGGAPAAGSNLRRVRWAVRATLSLGVAVSVAANVLHAQPHLISQAIAAWPPLALLLTVELISRVPTYRRSLAAVRLAATAAIAGIAAWVSYWHMAGVAARYGETGASAFLLPLSVDGLVIVASVSLVEIAGRISAAAPRHQPAQDAPASPATVTVAKPVNSHRGAAWPAVTAPSPATPSQHPPAKSIAAAATAAALPTPPPTAPAAQTPPTTGAPETPADDFLAPDATGGDDERPQGGDQFDAAPTDPVDGSHAARSGGAAAPSPTRHAQDGDGPVDDTTPPPVAMPYRDESAPSPEDGRDDGSVPSETAAAVAYWYRRDPDLHPAEIGARIGRSERTVRRYWPPAPNRGTDPVNGHRATVLADTFDLQ
jgi:hypothetical protein